MLATTADTLKYWFVPGSISFLILGFVAGVVLLYVRRAARWARAWLTMLAIAYTVLATPAAAILIERGLGPTPRPITRPADALGATAIVVLGAGAVTWGDGPLVVHQLSRRSVVNVLEAARLYRLLGALPIVVTGGVVNHATLGRSEADLMADALVTLQVPRSKITVEPRSINTYEQSVAVGPLVAGHARFVLVTTPVHLRRALALFEARGLHPVAGPSDLGALHDELSGARFYVPSIAALRASELAIYEYLAFGNAHARGWLAANDGIR